MSTNKSIRDQIKLAELLKLVPNRFLLTAAASKRARQLIDGARPLIDATLEHNLPLDIALLEIQMGKIHISIEDSYEESIIDEISDYLNSNILDEASEPKKPSSPAKDLKKKIKPLTA